MLIDYQNVSIYQADKCVLQNINFHIDEGEFAYLIGKVGSGKSSLLKTLYCELDLVEGETEKAEILGRISSCYTTAPFARTLNSYSRQQAGKTKKTEKSVSKRCSTK